jgi:hypothetical protein
MGGAAGRSAGGGALRGGGAAFGVRRGLRGAVGFAPLALACGCAPRRPVRGLRRAAFGVRHSGGRLRDAIRACPCPSTAAINS